MASSPSKIYLIIATLFCHQFDLMSQQEYSLTPNSDYYENIPHGSLDTFLWQSEIYPNTWREYYIYVPAQYDADHPAALMIFQDGHTYINTDGHFRVRNVFDNLIAQQKMPVTIGLFINPGHLNNADPPESKWRVSNRSIEYDDLSDAYARFLMEEIIPEVKKEYNISDDPKMHAICGISSGGICAFTSAWTHPEYFHKVLSHIGSFTNIRGGHVYPALIRKSERKDIKIYLQDGENDLDNQHGNWWLANLQMEAALKFKDYNYKFVGGSGKHDGNHGGAILPQSLIWLWNDVAPRYIDEGVYKFEDPVINENIYFSGESAHFSQTSFSVFRLKQTEKNKIVTNPLSEQFFIVKEGEVNIRIGSHEKVVGPKSVALVLAGDEALISSVSEYATVYVMRYTARNNRLKSTTSGHASFVVDFDEDVSYRTTVKGGRRSYFNRSTEMCPYYEMHMTTLKPGMKSHDAHVHAAAEIILMVEGNTEMEIGSKLVQGTAGDFYYMPSWTPHSIRNTGDTRCTYFAFQLY